MGKRWSYGPLDGLHAVITHVNIFSWPADIFHPQRLREAFKPPLNTVPRLFYVGFHELLTPSDH